MPFTAEDMIDSYFEVSLFDKKTERLVYSFPIPRHWFEKLTGVSLDDYEGGEYSIEAFVGEVGVYK